MTLTDADLREMEMRATRGHRMSVSDPDDPARVTPYSEILRLIADLRAARRWEWPDDWDHCHEDMGSDPCGKEPVGARRDPEEGSLYPVCRKHMRP